MPLLFAVLYVLLVILVCYVALLVVERLFGPLDPTIKAICGAVVLILVILYFLGALPLPRW